MRFKYHVVYSMQTGIGSTIGRCFYEANNQLDTVANIEAAEAFILGNAQKTDASAHKLFLTWWAPIKSDDGDQQIGDEK